MTNHEPPEDPTFSDLEGAPDGKKAEILFFLGQQAMGENHYNEAAGYFEMAAALCEKLDWDRQRYDAYGFLMSCFRHTGDWDSWLELARKHERDASLVLDPKDAEEFHRICGFGYEEKRMSPEALWSFAEAEISSRLNENFYTATLAMHAQARIYILLREYGRARELLVDALTLARQKANSHIAASIETTLGKYFLEIGDVDAAIVVLREAMRSIEAQDDRRWPSPECKIALATAYARAGMTAEAEPLLKSLNREVNSFDVENRAAVMILRSEVAGNPSDAAEYREKARALAVNEGLSRVVNVCDTNAAVEAMERDDLDSAERILFRVLESTERFDDSLVADEARVRLANVLIETMRADEALAYLNEVSVVNIKPGSLAALRHSLARAAAHFELDDLDMAETCATIVTDAPRTRESLALAAEGHWIRALIELKRESDNSAAEHHLGLSVMLSHQSGDHGMAESRSQMFAFFAGDEPDAPRERLVTVDDLLRSIAEERAAHATDSNDDATGAATDE